MHKQMADRLRAGQVYILRGANGVPVAFANRVEMRALARPPTNADYAYCFGVLNEYLAHYDCAYLPEADDCVALMHLESPLDRWQLEEL
jgi:hypothetical protein